MVSALNNNAIAGIFYGLFRVFTGYFWRAAKNSDTGL